MRIFGGRDFYDGAGQGTDESVTFLRKTEVFTDTPFHVPESSSRSYPGYAFMTIIIADEIFPAMIETSREYNRATATYDYSRFIHYTLEDAMKAAQRLMENATFTRYHYTRTLRGSIEAHFAQTISDEQKRWLVMNNIVTGRVFNDREENYINTLEANTPNLTEFEVFRVINPAVAHMRIAGYISGVLGTSPDTVQIGNDARIRKAGFDDESFRTRKGTKKPRRRNA